MSKFQFEAHFSQSCIENKGEALSLAENARETVASIGNILIEINNFID